MVSHKEAKQMNYLLLKHDWKTVIETFPQYSKRIMQRAISDHIDREIEKHRKQKQKPMARVLTFSRTFPAYHQKAGQPTYFVEMFIRSINCWSSEGKAICNKDVLAIGCEKHHTIRVGSRWKVGDKFSPRVWSGKPYRSKQIVIAPDTEVAKVWNIGLRIRGDYKEFYCGDEDLTSTSINMIAKNDGLTIEDFFSWFNKPFTGQIICWNPSIHY